MSNAGSDWSAAFAAASADSMRVYDRVLARLFTPWAHDLITRLAPAAGSSALDVACGPGTVARLLARAVGPTGHVRATDISPAMLEIAQTKPLDEGSAPIE